MKKRLPFLVLLISLALAACKKDGVATVDPQSKDTVTRQQPAAQIISVSAVLPANVTAGTVATITGDNLGTSSDGLAVYFNGIQATIQSVSPTEIKVVVPQTSSGNITFKINGAASSASTALSFTYYNTADPALYVSGDVNLVSQADVDAFVKGNKGKSFQITGNLTVGSPAFESMSDIIQLTAFPT